MPFPLPDEAPRPEAARAETAERPQSCMCLVLEGLAVLLVEVAVPIPREATEDRPRPRTLPLRKGCLYSSAV